jgi:hypothetical protein
MAMLLELRQYFAFKAEDKLPDSAEVDDLLGMRSMWQVVRRYSLRNLISAKDIGPEHPRGSPRL